MMISFRKSANTNRELTRIIRVKNNLQTVRRRDIRLVLQQDKF